MPKTINFNEPVQDLYGAPLQEQHAPSDQNPIACPKCGVLEAQEVTTRDLRLGAVCVAALVKQSQGEKISDADVARRMILAQRIAGEKQGEWREVEFEDPADLVMIRECVSKGAWAIQVRHGVNEALKM